MSNAQWQTATQASPCPVCGRGDWCAVSKDRSAAICRRVDTGGSHKTDRAGVDYWLHRLTDDRPDLPAVDSSAFSDNGGPAVGLAAPDDLDRAYTALLALLELEDRHQPPLVERGITDAAIDDGEYRTLPPKGRAELAAKVAARVGADTLAGVPGFHHHETTGDLIVGGKAGLLVPVRDLQQRIVALKVRADDPGAGGKYLFVSSAHRGGASPGAPVHIPIHAAPSDPDQPLTVRVTEGELKADAATLSDGILTISVPGVASWRKALTLATEMGATGIRLAFDSDWAENPRVATALAGAAKAFLTKGYETWVETWPAGHAKGIDDLLVQGLRPRALAADTWLASRGEDPVTPTQVADDVQGGTISFTPGEYALSDDGNALRLMAAFGSDLRYDTASGRWLVWDGRRWATDDRFESIRRARTVARAIAREADETRDIELSKRLRRWANQSQGKGRLDAMISLARTDPGVAVAPQDLDADPYAFNCLNGTVDLRTGELSPHDRDAMHTRLAPVTYDPDARHPTWDRFLEDLTGGDTALEEFLKRLVGYSLLGDAREEILPVLYGSGGTGKSTFVDAIRAMSGDYGTTADFESFIDRKFGGGVRNDIAALAGARIVTSIEVDDGKKLAVALVKSITGGDTIKARYLYKEAFEFRPQFALWLVCNHSPSIPHDDSGMWRRVLRIPMDRVVPPDQRDPQIKATLRDPAVGGPAVLAWAIQGCIEYLKHGLQVPESIHAETERYRVEQDPLAGLWGDYVVKDGNGFTANPDVMTAYRAWAEADGEPRPMSQRALGAALAEHKDLKSTTKRRSGKVLRGWEGLALGPLGLEAVAATEPTIF